MNARERWTETPALACASLCALKYPSIFRQLVAGPANMRASVAVAVFTLLAITVVEACDLPALGTCVSVAQAKLLEDAGEQAAAGDTEVDCPVITAFYAAYEKCMVDTEGCCSQHEAVRDEIPIELATQCPSVAKVFDKCDGKDSGGGSVRASISFAMLALVLALGASGR
jgi:hypothetical protein